MYLGVASTISRQSGVDLPSLVRLLSPSLFTSLLLFTAAVDVWMGIYSSVYVGLLVGVPAFTISLPLYLSIYLSIYTYITDDLACSAVPSVTSLFASSPIGAPPLQLHYIIVLALPYPSLPLPLPLRVCVCVCTAVGVDVAHSVTLSITTHVWQCIYIW